MPRSAKAAFAGCISCIGALLVLAAACFGSDSVQRVDSDLLGRIMTRTGDEAGPVVNSVGGLADPVWLALVLALACGIALWRRRPFDAAAALTVVAGANLTTAVLKALLSHPRIQPALLHGEMPPASFPSGHATAAVSMVIAMALVVPESWRPAVAAVGGCFVIAVNVAALILAWHYPSDVIAGDLVACAWGFAVLGVQRFIEEPVDEGPVSPAARPPSPRSSQAPPDWQASRG